MDDNTVIQAAAAPSSTSTTPEGERILQQTIALIPMLRARAQENEARQGLHPDVLQALRDAGVFTMAHPRQWGGYALMPSEQARIQVQLARGDGSAAWQGMIAGIACLMLGGANMRVQEEVFSSGRGPTHAGKLEPLPGCVARETEGGWLIKGRWPFSSTLDHADWVHGGALFETRDGEKFPGVFYMPKDESWIMNDWDVMGMAASASGSFEIKEEIFVPAHRCEPTLKMLMGRAEYADEQPLFAVNVGLYTALLSLSTTLGLFSTVLEQWQEALPTRKQAHPDLEFQAQHLHAHVQMGDYNAHRRTLEIVVKEMGEVCDDYSLRGVHVSPGEQAEWTAIFSRLQCQTTDLAVEIMRNSSTATIFRSNPVQRAIRDLIVMTMHAGGNRDRSLEAFGRDLLGLPPLMQLGAVGRKAPPPPN